MYCFVIAQPETALISSKTFPIDRPKIKQSTRLYLYAGILFLMLICLGLRELGFINVDPTWIVIGFGFLLILIPFLSQIRTKT